MRILRYCLVSLFVMGAWKAVLAQFAFSHGAIIRGDVSAPHIALVLTGDEYADGASHIANVLDSVDIKASFFLTGRFYRNPQFADYIKRLQTDGHYLGAHSNRHLLYCSWANRDSLLVTREEFRRDVLDNYMEMKEFGIAIVDAPYFLPAYEWYNQRIAEWTGELGLTLINYTPGTRSHADYTTPAMGEHYIASDVITESILAYESSSPHGLNGFILLTHIGVHPDRVDKYYLHLGPLIAELKKRGYVFVRIDKLLAD